MSEVIRYLASYTPYEGLDLNGQCNRHDGDYFVSAIDFDRVTAERDASLGREAALLKERDQLQQRVDVLEGFLREVVAIDPRGEFLGWQLDGKIDAELKPAQEKP